MVCQWPFLRMLQYIKLTTNNNEYDNNIYNKFYHYWRGNTVPEMYTLQVTCKGNSNVFQADMHEIKLYVCNGYWLL